jgi:hypothetical protein
MRKLYSYRRVWRSTYIWGARTGHLQNVFPFIFIPLFYFISQNFTGLYFKNRIRRGRCRFRAEGKYVRRRRKIGRKIKK